MLPSITLKTSGDLFTHSPECLQISPSNVTFILVNPLINPLSFKACHATSELSPVNIGFLARNSSLYPTLLDREQVGVRLPGDIMGFILTVTESRVKKCDLRNYRIFCLS